MSWIDKLLNITKKKNAIDCNARNVLKRLESEYIQGRLTDYEYNALVLSVELMEIKGIMK